MIRSLSRRSFFGALGTASLVGASILGGCSGASASSSASSTAGSASAGAVAIGTLATEDILPFWVAEEEGIFAQRDLAVDIVTFQSATELIAGVASGEVDLAMTDIMVAASMFASGIDVRLEWVTLGASADQGRFGIMVGPDSDVETLADLAGVPIGVGSNTILEYVMDRLMLEAGVPAEDIVVEELQKLPVRYQAMVSGEVAAAALPGSLLALGEANGCRTIADDSTGDNLSQSVMIARAPFIDSAAGAEQLGVLEDVWDEAAALINRDSEAYRATLVRNANLSDAVADTYPLSQYPEAEMPSASMVDPILDWMEEKGYLTQPLAYDEATGEFSLGN